MKYHDTEFRGLGRSPRFTVPWNDPNCKLLTDTLKDGTWGAAGPRSILPC